MARQLVILFAVAAAAFLAGWWQQHAASDRLVPSLEPPPPVCGSPWFENAAIQAGLDFRHVATLGADRLFPEIIGGGAGWLDHDGDGDLDLYLVQSGDVTSKRPDLYNRLYRNEGDGTFVDVTKAAGVDDDAYGMGCACGDYDGDGHVDLYVTNYGANVLYRNRGDGTFEDVTARAGVGTTYWSLGAAFLDHDGDGDLDLFVANYVLWAPRVEIECRSSLGTRDYCSPKNYDAPAPDLLYENNGDGTFSDASAKAGIDRAYGNGMGVVVADLDRDGWLDIYVANDGTPNQLWLNDGAGRFTDGAMGLGCSVNRHGAAEAGMGVVAVDVDSDGALDLLLTHLRYESNTCYVFADGAFDDRTARLGLAVPSLRYTGFGIGAADFDQDGALDLLVVNGAVGLEPPYFDGQDPFAQPDLLFRGGERGSGFVEVPCGGQSRNVARTSRAAAFADYDEDGDIDAVVVDRDHQVRLLRNVASNPGRWIRFRLRDKSGGDATGALVGIRTGDTWQWRVSGRTYSYLSSNDPRIHFGLPDRAEVDEVLVHWPRGDKEFFGPRPTAQTHELREGR